MKKIIKILVLLLLVGCSKKPIIEDLDVPETELEINPPVEKVVYTSIFNGQELEEEQDQYQAFSIMISNSKEARPQSAIGLADVVYEIAVETYTITRFLAIFGNTFPNKVGPVRSARIPFVQMVQEWNIPYAHYGAAGTGQGNAEALIDIIKPPKRFDGVKGINNEFFYRSTDRKAPHNAYFDSEKALVKIPALEYQKHFEFGKETNINQTPINKLSLRYSAYTPVKYEYDTQLNKYKRFIQDQPMIDAYTNEQVAVTNIIVLHAPHRMVESYNYVLVDFIGSGKAEYYINGYYEEGVWKKDSYESKTQFINSQGEPVVLLAGNTWVQVVHPRVDITRE